MAALLGVGVLLPPSGANTSNRPTVPQVVKRVEAAAGTVYLATNNTIERFIPATGEQSTAITFPPGSEISDSGGAGSG